MYYDNGYIFVFADETRFLESGLIMPPVESYKEILAIEGDTLFSIANREYRNTRYWIIIAEFNDLVDPFNIITGATIKIPQLS